MKQIQLKKPGGLDNILFCDADVPKPKSNQIVIKIVASSLNYHDLLVALGFIPTEDGRVPLSDAAGEIVEIGSDVKDWKVGDHVISVCFPNWQKWSTKI